MLDDLNLWHDFKGGWLPAESIETETLKKVFTEGFPLNDFRTEEKTVFQGHRISLQNKLGGVPLS